MCWSGEASAVIAAAGVVGTAYLIKKKESPNLWIPLGYFTMMEVLQAITYRYLGGCDLPANQILTLLGYLHISFQPFFTNLVSLYFIPEKIRQKIAGFVYGICFVGTILFLVKLYPLSWAGNCTVGSEPLCGANLCSTFGAWHLAWNVPLNGIPLLMWLGYAVPIFILPMLYGSWRSTIYFFIWPAVTWLLAPDLNEWPAVWCLFSVGILAIAIARPLRDFLRQEKYYFWRFPNF